MDLERDPVSWGYEGDFLFTLYMFTIRTTDMVIIVLV